MNIAAFGNFMDATLKLSAPLLFASLGELIAERAGVINIGIEGMMLTGSFAGFWTALSTGNTLLGIAAGVLSAVAMALVFGLLTVRSRADQIVVGTAVNLIAIGLTGSLYRGIFGTNGSALMVKMLPPIPLPGLSRLPVIGPALFRQNALVYLGILLVPVVAFALYRTGAGISLRAAGEEPKAADAAGVDVLRVRLTATLIGGALAGLGGAYLSLASANTFTEGMTAGRGFIALAIVIFGRWSPWGALWASLLFGATDALQFALQSQGYAIPYQLLLALPYVASLVILTVSSGKSRGPAALALPYIR
jgi:ABC-type uncharacterized transport system permease subunit